MGDGSASIQAAQAHPGQSLIIAGRGRLNHLLGPVMLLRSYSSVVSYNNVYL